MLRPTNVAKITEIAEQIPLRYNSGQALVKPGWMEEIFIEQKTALEACTPNKPANSSLSNPAPARQHKGKAAL